MKKLVLTIAIVLGMTFAASAQYFGDNGQPQGGGLFGRGETRDGGNSSSVNTPLLPGHGLDTNQDAPLGSGGILLIGFGAAYALSKKNKK
ncbi:MAG: hypothetical protein KBT57_07040 [bacterium]|nr:hypothetical protein [Candidatus Limimorpha equi]